MCPVEKIIQYPFVGNVDVLLVQLFLSQTLGRHFSFSEYEFKMACAFVLGRGGGAMERRLNHSPHPCCSLMFPISHSRCKLQASSPFYGRSQNSLPITTNFSQKLTQSSKGISLPSWCSSQNGLCPGCALCLYIT